jgi:hypothetical protein
MLNASVGVSGVWKQTVGMWVGVAGEWKFVWAPVTGGNVSDTKATAYPTAATAFIRWSSDGTFDRSQGNDLFSWLVGGTGSDYDIYFTQSSGSTVTGTLNSWLSLGSSRTLSLTDDVAGTAETASGAYQIRHSPSSTVVATGNWTLNADSDI